uniref:Uncharacterized protein n=1 Tax=Megaselia scalaris TaxID=36166 RepID=T1GBS7_MEGSC
MFHVTFGQRVTDHRFCRLEKEKGKETDGGKKKKLIIRYEKCFVTDFYGNAFLNLSFCCSLVSAVGCNSDIMGNLLCYGNDKSFRSEEIL